MQTLTPSGSESFEQLMAQEFPKGLGDGLVELVPNLEEDIAIRQRAAQFIGACVTGEQLQMPESVAATSPIESLYDAILLAYEGDPTAQKMVETNVRTDVIERTIKSGHVMKVHLDVDEAGAIQQHGQSMESVQANSLRLASNHPHMLERTKAEATNAFRIQELYKDGILEDYYFVVFSRAADGMSKREMDEAGFFTDTMSSAYQVTSVERGVLVTESAFVAGRREPNGERHDKQGLTAVTQWLGKGDIYAGLDDAQTIARPLLVHKSLMPDGVVDLVSAHDAGLGENIFFGQSQAPEAYGKFAEQCLRREQTLQPKVDEITRRLIAAAPYLEGPLEACEKMAQISERHMVEQAVFDTDINPLVFGQVAASYIDEARRQFEMGNLEEGLELTQKAIHTADSSSCPGGLKSSKDGTEGKEDSKEANDGDCEFVSKECPICHKKNVKTTVTKHKITGDCLCEYDKITKKSKKSEMALAA